MANNRALNVLVYNGTGTTSESVRHCIYTLQRLLYPNYAVIPIEETTLLKKPWTSTCALLVMPGGADLGYSRVLNGRGNQIISQYVRAGGRYLGFCAGGYYGSKKCEFAVGDKSLEVIGSRELAFFPGTCRGPVFKDFEYHSERGARASRLRINREALPLSKRLEETIQCYSNGGGAFVDASSMTNADVEVLADYEDDVPFDTGTGKAAIVYCKIGKGSVILTGPHPEYVFSMGEKFDPENLKEQPDLPHYRELLEKLRADEAPRTQMLKSCLMKMGLEVNTVSASIPSLTRLHVAGMYGDEIQELAQTLDDIISKEGNDEFIRGDLDKFRILRSNTPAPSAAELSKGGGDVKELVLYETEREALWPGKAISFNYAEFYDQLKRYRDSDYQSGEWGNILMYGKVVTSTNTLLEKNHKLLSKLPTGFTFTARTQTNGRGRGSNVWVAPPGQLIFSTVINHPYNLGQTRPVIFTQYLAGIAVVEAIHGYGRGYDKLGIKLKWPNDIYAFDPNKPSSPPVKIGGILSNCSFSDGKYQVVLGIGINTTNEQPTTSLNQLLPSNLAPFVIERLLARILTRLEALYKSFCKYGFEGDLERRFYQHWLHDKQIVTVETEGGTRARVVGITMDWGMLKVEELGREDKATGKVWTLQSDENSFDFWKGLVRAKV